MANQYKNKVVYNGATLIDLTGDTVTAANLAQGITAHDASGAPITGTMSGGAVIISDSTDAHGGTIREITATDVVNLQSGKTVNPTESSQTVEPDTGYDAFESVTVGAISSSYVGSGVTRRSGSDLTASGATVTVPSGYYASSASKSVSTMTVPTSLAMAPTTGYTKVLTIDRQTSKRYINIREGYNTASSYYEINPVADGTAGTPTATKGAVNNHSVSVTPTVTNTTGYITGGTKTGTAVTVSASELVSGTMTITENGTGIDVANLQSVDVEVEGASADMAYIIANRQTIGSTAFSPSATYIGPFAFCSTTALQNASFPEVTLIASGAFYSCDRLTTVSFPKVSISGLSGYAFAGCSRLLSASFSRITYIPERCFGDCWSLADLKFDNASSIYSNAFLNCRAITSITSLAFPKVTHLYEYAFAGCTSLEEVNFSTVTTIRSGAFSGCSALTTVSFSAAKTIGSSAFNRCGSLETVSMPAVTEIASYAFQYCSALSTISFPDVSTVGSFAFEGCIALRTVNIPNLSGSINSRTFAGCSALESVYFSNIIYVNQSAFASCHSLETVSMPAATYIYEYAFQYCSALSTISFPVVNAIYSYAFRNCSALKSVYFPNLAQMGNMAFGYCTELTTVSLPKITTIQSYAFSGCSKLESVYLLSTSYVATLLSSNAFTDTPLAKSTYLGYYGSIFVPQELLATYKSRSGWSYFSSRFVGVDV